MRVHVKQYVAQRVRLDDEGGLARRRVADSYRLRVELENLREPRGRLVRLVAEVEGEAGRDDEFARELLDAALGQLLRDERDVEVAEGRVVARDEEFSVERARLVRRAFDVNLRLEPVVLPQTVERDERGRELDERGGGEACIPG